MTEMITITYEISDVENERRLKFIRNHEKCCQTSDGSGLSIEYAPCSIGLAIVMHCACGEKENITDFDDW